jgi:hypothetical protein
MCVLAFDGTVMVRRGAWDTRFKQDWQVKTDEGRLETKEKDISSHAKDTASQAPCGTLGGGWQKSLTAFWQKRSTAYREIVCPQLAGRSMHDARSRVIGIFCVCRRLYILSPCLWCT